MSSIQEKMSTRAACSACGFFHLFCNLVSRFIWVKRSHTKINLERCNIPTFFITEPNELNLTNPQQANIKKINQSNLNQPNHFFYGQTCYNDLTIGLTYCLMDYMPMMQLNLYYNMYSIRENIQVVHTATGFIKTRFAKINKSQQQNEMHQILIIQNYSDHQPMSGVLD